MAQSKQTNKNKTPQKTTKKHQKPKQQQQQKASKQTKPHTHHQYQVLSVMWSDDSSGGNPLLVEMQNGAATPEMAI